MFNRKRVKELADEVFRLNRLADVNYDLYRDEKRQSKKLLDEKAKHGMVLKEIFGKTIIADRRKA